MRSHTDGAAGLSLAEAQSVPSSQTPQDVVELAVQVLPGCEWATITWLRGQKLGTAASTDPVIDRVDALQYRLEEGPCVVAAWSEPSCLVHDTATDARWARWTPTVLALGVRSVLSLRLAVPGRTIGILSLYASKPTVFADGDIESAREFASRAAAALVSTRQECPHQRRAQLRHGFALALRMLTAAPQLSFREAANVLRGRWNHEHVGVRLSMEAVMHELGVPVPSAGWAVPLRAGAIQPR